MPDEDILAQFQEFLTQKQEADKANADAEDYDVEVWDEKGRGARVRRSHAKPFLNTLGIDLDAEPEPESQGDDKTKTKPARQSTGKQATSQASTSIVRKYFAPKAPGKLVD